MKAIVLAALFVMAPAVAQVPAASSSVATTPATRPAAPDLAEIKSFRAEVRLDVLMAAPPVSVQAYQTSPTQPDPGMKSDLAASAKRALQAARGNASLTAAVKKLYVAAVAFIENANSVTPVRDAYGLQYASQQAQASRANLKAAVDSADAALELELVTADASPG